MTTTQDLGEITATYTQWAERARRADGTGGEDHISTDEQHVRSIVAFDLRAVERARERGAVCGLDGLTDAEVVARTVTEFASGHRLTGPWTVAE